MLLWTSRRAAWKALRWLSVAVLPAVLLTLYFTYSRGGLLALVVASGCLLVLSRDRLWLLATLAIGALGALPAVLAVQARHSLAENLANQAAVDQGATVLLILLAGIALALLLFAGAAPGRAPRGAVDRTGAASSPATRTLLKRLALVAAVLRDRRCDRGRRPRLGPVLHPPTSSSPTSRSSTSPSSPAPGGTTSGGSRSTPSAKSRSSATGPGRTSSPGTSSARSTPPVHNAHSLYLEAFAELGVVGGLLVLALVGIAALVRLRRLARRPASASATATRRCSPAMLAFAVGAGFDWFWEIAGLGAVFFLAAGVVVARPLRAARAERAAKTRERAALRAGRRRPGARLDRGDRPGRAAARRPRDQGQPERRGQRRSGQRRQPRQDRPLDRALRRLPLRAARPARRAAARIPDRGHPAQQRDRTRRPELAALLPAFSGRARSRRRRRGAGRLRTRPTAEPARGLPAKRRLELRMSPRTTPRRGRDASHEAGAAAAGRDPASRDGRRGSRCRLRRDRAARAAAAPCCAGCSPAATGSRWSRALCLATAATATTDVGTLFWAVLFSPIWIMVLKLNGLYDNDHRRIRHSTLDELPALISACALGTLALDGLLALSPVGPLSAASAIVVGVGALIGIFVLRGVLRFFWHRLAGVATGVVIGPGGAVGVVARRVATHPETRLRLVGYLSPRAGEGPDGRDRRAEAARLDRRHLPHRPREQGRAGDRRRAGDERGRGRAPDRGVQGGRPRPHLPAPSLRPARTRHRAQPPRRAARPRLPLFRPVALDGDDEADDRRGRLAAPCWSCSPPCSRRSRC